MVRLSAPNTLRGLWRGWPASGNPPGTGARECSDRELIAMSPPEAPVRGRKRCGDPVESGG